MTEITFHRGWTMLVMQPYGKDLLGHDEEKYEQMLALFQQTFLGFTDTEWMDVTHKWVRTQDHWPLIPDLLSMLRQRRPVPRSTPADPARQATDTTVAEAVAAPSRTDDWHDLFPRFVFAEATKRHATIVETWLDLAPLWLMEHPSHPDRTRVEDQTRRFQQPPPQPPTRPSVSPTIPSPLSTDLKASGTLGLCPFCQCSVHVLICWCGLEGCTSCLTGHLQTGCPGPKRQMYGGSTQRDWEG